MSSWFHRLRPGLIVFGICATGGAAYQLYGASGKANLDPQIFSTFELIGKQRVSSSSAIFTLRSHAGAVSPSIKDARQQGVWSVQIKQPQLQIARAYTPLPPDEDESDRENGGSGDIRLLIRQEHRGEVSTYLHNLPQQAPLEIRGPHIECALPHDVEAVIFLAGGTGIAPAMQVADVLSRRKGSRMDILWANRRREECIGGISDKQTQDISRPAPWWRRSFIGKRGVIDNVSTVNDTPQDEGTIVAELQQLRKRSESAAAILEIRYYVDEEKSIIKPAELTRCIQSSTSRGQGVKLIMVSGPDGFIQYWAGRKVWEGGIETQGPLGGVLGQLDLKDWKVVKL